MPIYDEDPPKKKGTGADDEEPLPLGVEEGFVAGGRIERRFADPVDVQRRQAARFLGVKPSQVSGPFGGVVGPTTLEERLVGGVPATFYEGDEEKPANLPPQEILKIQRKLVKSGLLDSLKRVTPGDWDQTTQSAFAQLLAFANRSGIRSWDQAFTAYQQFREREGLPIGEEEDKKLPILLSNPEDVKRSFREVALREMGSVSDQQLEVLTNTFLTIERAKAEQDAAAEQEALNRGSQQFITEAPSPDASAIIEEKFPAQVAGTRIRQAEQEFFNLLSAPTPQIGG